MYDDPADTGIRRRMQVLRWIATNHTIYFDNQKNNKFPLIFDFSFDYKK